MSKFKSIIYCLCLLMLPLSMHATHIVGGDMTYRKISSDPVKKTSKFLITMNLRRDCFNGAPNAEFDKFAKVRIFYTNGQTWKDITMPFMADDTLNNYVQSDCGFEGTQVCVHETRYLYTIDLPSYEGGYIFAYQRCCRNGSINNIVEPLETGATYSVTIPKEAFTSNNSSPSFKQWPAVYICNNENLDFDNSAVDLDGDSLVYKLCTPKIGLTRTEPEGYPSSPPFTDLTWLPPYDLNNLMGGVPLAIDPKTGRMTARPNAIGQYVIGVCVEEYRNGVKIGEIRRDFQYNVRTCSPPPTAIFEAPSNLCKERTIQFKNNSIAANKYEWDFNFPSTDPAFKSTVQNPTFTFPGVGTYKVKLTVIRNSDDCRDEEVKEIKITDLPYKANFAYDIKACNPDGTISAILTDISTSDDVGATSTKWNWTLTQDGNTQTSSTNPAEFIINPANFNVLFDVEASNACKGSISENVVFDSKIFKSDFDISLEGCNQNNELQIKLIDLSQGLNSNYVVTERTWQVNYGQNTMPLFGNNVTVTIPRTDFNVTLDVNTDKNCRNNLSKNFPIDTIIPSIDFKYALGGCDSDNKAIITLQELSNDTVNYAYVTAYNWTIKDGNQTGQNIEYVTSLQDSFQAKLVLTFDDNCTTELSKDIKVDELRPKVNFAYIASDCPSDNLVNLVFTYDNKDNKGLGNNGINWKIGTSQEIKDYNISPITIAVPKDSTIYATIFTEFENGCKDILANQFIPGPYATLTIINDSLTLCPGESKPLITNGNNLFDYTWTPKVNLDLKDPSNPVLTAKSDQIYEVIVADGLCQVKGKIVVDVLESLILDIDGSNKTCDGSVLLTANGGFGTGKYEWYKDSKLTQKVGEGDTLRTNFNTISQSYYLTFISDKFCNADSSVFEVVNQTPRFDIIGPYMLCFGDTIPTNNVFNTEPSHNNSILWESNSHIISGGNTLKPVVGNILNGEKEFTLYFNAVNQHGCTHRDSLEFEIIPNPKVDFDKLVKDCGNFEVCLTFDKTEGEKLYGTPKWEFGDGKSEPGNAGVEVCHKYNSAGEYTIKLSNLSLVCPFEDVVKTIKLNDRFPTFDNDQAEECINTDYTLQLPDKAKNLPFVWKDINGNILSNEANPKVSIKSDTSFVLNVKDENNCAFDDTFYVKAFVYDLSITVPNEVCTTGLYEINSVANQGINFEYTWSPANAIVSGGSTGNPTVDVAKSKNYTVVLKHPTLGCEIEKSVNFNFFNFDYSLNKPTIFCLNQLSEPSITVAGNLDYIYEWSPASLIQSGGNTATPKVNVIGDSKLFVKVVHPTLGCVLRDSIQITTTELTIDVEAQPNGEVPKGQIVVVSVVNPQPKYTYTWSNGFIGTSQSVKIEESTTYTVTATDENGCTGLARISIEVRPPQCVEDVFLPTAFSPNGDSANDVLMVKSNYITEMELVIYNRWGQEVFSSKDINIGWDGTLLGEALAPDVYAYWLKAKCGEGDEIVKKGNISLIR